MRTSIVRNQDWMYELYEEGGSHFLSVMCGGIGMYERVVKLTPDEMERYRSQGNHVLDDLRRRIATGDDMFAGRDFVGDGK